MEAIMLWLCMASLQQGRPGPLDAFRANQSAVKVDITSEFTAGRAIMAMFVTGNS